jgi:hypothetical protein
MILVEQSVNQYKEEQKIIVVHRSLQASYCGWGKGTFKQTRAKFLTPRKRLDHYIEPRTIPVGRTGNTELHKT